MKYITIAVTHFEQNCSLIYCDVTKEAVAVDPGGDIDLIINTAVEEQLKITKIVLTHGHIDHVGGSKSLATLLNIPIIGPHMSDQYLLESLPVQSGTFGFDSVEAFEPDQWLDDGHRVSFGDETLEVIHTPGHTPGHITLFHRQGRIAFVGDVLFYNSIGRTDFPGGDHPTLIHSIKERLFPLGDDITFVPGHGPVSTFGYEKAHNPFL